MKWYFIVLIVLGSIGFLNALAYYIFRVRHKELTDIIVFPIIILMFSFVLPFAWLVSPYFFFSNMEAGNNYKTFSKWKGKITKENVAFEGFRLYIKSNHYIYVQNNGRGFYTYKTRPTKKMREIIDIIKHLPDETVKKMEIENYKNQKDGFLKDLERQTERIKEIKEEIKKVDKKIPKPKSKKR